MPWLWLGLAGLLEVGWALAMKQSQGFMRPLPTILMLAGMVSSFGLLALAMRDLPLGTSYAIWTGIGAVGTLAVGVVFLGESLTVMRSVAALLIVLGMSLLKLSSS
jgi:quaternary ammonium compound-resistance protein SugE